MANPRNRNPRAVWEDQQRIDRDQKMFSGGMNSDDVISMLPENQIAYSANWILHDMYADVRSGTEILSSTELPSLYTGITATKSGTTITVTGGHTVAAADVGKYFVWDNGADEDEYITAANTVAGTYTVNSSTARSAATAATMRAEPNALIWHKGQKKYILMIGQKLYYAPWNVTAWTEIYSLSPNDLPVDAKSKIVIRGDNAYLFNTDGTNGGIYMIRLGDTIPVYKKINITMNTRTISDSGQETEDIKYCRRYITTMCEMSGNTLLNRINGNVLVHESAPSALDADNRDYAEVWTEKPIGSADTTYGVLTGGTLAAGVDTPAEWEAITNGQANFTANGETHNIVVDFSGCLTFAEVASKIQSALRDFWPQAVFDFNTNRFVFTMPNDGDTVSYCTAGSAGTDISTSTHLNMRTAQGTITHPTVTQQQQLNGFFAKKVIGAAQFTARYGHAVVSYDSKIWVIGGKTATAANTALNDVWYSADNGETWTAATTDGGGSVWTARSFHACVVFNSKMWIVGGVNTSGTSLNDVYYSTNGATWTQATANGGADQGATGDNIFGVLTAPKLLNYDSKIWIVGGRVGTNACPVYYSTTGGAWTRATAHITWGYTVDIVGGAYVLNGKMWVALANDNVGSGNLRDVLYSTDGATWTNPGDADFNARLDLTEYYMSCDFAVVNNVVFAYVGKPNVQEAFYYGREDDRNIFYSYNGYTFYSLQNGVAYPARFYAPIVGHEGKLYLIGGYWEPSTFGNDVYVSDEYMGLALIAPQTTSGSNYYYPNEFTHYTLWATEDAGPLGIKKSGQGNDEELYIWAEDVPMIKAYVLSAAATGIVTASKGTFHEYDVGSLLVATDGTEGIIVTYKNPTSVTWSRTDVLTNVGATIGTDYSFTASQAAYTVTIALPAAGRFAATDVGKRIFWSDGTTSIITGYTSATVVTVADSTTRTAMGGGILYSPSTTAYENYRNFNDTMTDQVLRSHLSSYWLRNRYWVPLPSSNTGCFWGDFMVCATRNSRKIYYNELLDDYMVGYYSSYWQKNDIDDAISELRSYKSTFSVFCTHSVSSFYPDKKIQKEIPELGELVSVLAYKETRSNSIGCVDWGSIVSVEDGVDAFMTSDGEVRMFDGITFGNNLVGKNMKAMRKLQPIGTASYDAIRGYLRWGTESALTNSRLPFPDVCWNFAVTKDQGVGGGVYITGTDWIKPPDGIAGMQIIDGSDHSRQVALDNKSGKLYWISTYDGPTGSGLGISFVDKDDTTGAGTEITANMKYRGHTGSSEFVFITHDESHFFFSPDDILKKSTTGHDANGYRTGTEINIKLYKNYEPTTEYDSSSNIPKEGDVSFTDEQECHVHQFEIISNRSEVQLRGSKHLYWQDNRANEPSLRTMTEDDYQEDLCQPVLWPSIVSGSLINRINNAAIVPGTYQLALGPTGDMDALSFSQEIDFGVVNITNGTVLFWEYEDSVAVRIGVNDGSWLTPVSAGSFASAYGTWYLMYALGVTDHGALIFSPTGGPSIWNPQVFNSAISTAALAWLLADMTSGRQIIVPTR